MVSLPQDGLVAVVKRDCPTCELTAPVLGELARRAGLTVVTQDDPSFPDTVPGPVHDIALDVSHRLKIEIVPTLIRLEGGREIGADVVVVRDSAPLHSPNLSVQPSDNLRRMT